MRFIRTEKQRVRLIVLLWTLSLAGVYLEAIYRQASLGVLDYSIAAAICIIAGAALMDLGRAVIGYFVSIALGMIIVFVFATLPEITGTVPPPGDQTLAALWISIIIKQVLPAPFLIFLVSSVIGSFIGERYF